MFKLIIAGNLGKDAELKEVNGQLVIQFSLAVNQNYTDNTGQKIEKSTWVSCSKWQEKGSKTGIVNYLKKGSKVLVEGIPDVQVWTDQQGNKRADLRCKIQHIHLMHSTAQNVSSNVTSGEKNMLNQAAGNEAPAFVPTDDLPF
jgi:single-strand DNA-binding protein